MFVRLSFPSGVFVMKFYVCDAATQRGSWPPHSWCF